MIMDQARRVVVAEDNTLVRRLICSLVEDRGYQVVGQAVDGREAVALAGELRPDVILLDLEMPEMDGIEAANAIANCCPTPIVVLTAYDVPELVEGATKAGVGAYLIKPPEADAMDRAITVAVARHHDLMELRRLNRELQETLDEVRKLRGMLPTCASCKRIRTDSGYWEDVADYLHKHAAIEFTHGLCPDCMAKLYPDLMDDLEDEPDTDE
jgi:AmiR/NasT family two-component response regulator